MTTSRLVWSRPSRAEPIAKSREEGLAAWAIGDSARFSFFWK